MATEIKNLFKVNGEDCSFAVEYEPTQDSVAFVTAGAVHKWYVSLSQYINRDVVTDRANLNYNSSNIPTVGLIYEACAQIHSNSRHLISELPHAVFYGVLSSIPSSTNTQYPLSDYLGKTIFCNKKFHYFDSRGSHYEESPSKTTIYYNAVTKKLCIWLSDNTFEEIG